MKRKKIFKLTENCAWNMQKIITESSYYANCLVEICVKYILFQMLNLHKLYPLMLTEL